MNINQKVREHTKEITYLKNWNYGLAIFLTLDIIVNVFLVLR